MVQSIHMIHICFTVASELCSWSPWVPRIPAKRLRAIHDGLRGPVVRRNEDVRENRWIIAFTRYMEPNWISILT